MSFTQSTFTPVSSQGNSDSPNLWTYRTEDTVAEVLAADYFIKKKLNLNDGDFINIVACDDRFVGFFNLNGGISVERIEFNPTTDMLIDRVLEGTSLAASQSPAGLGIANALTVEYGVAQLGPTDPAQLSATGRATFNTGGLYRIKSVFQLGRTGAAGVSEVFFRFLVNGVQIGRSVAVKLNNSDDLEYVDIDNWFNVPQGATLDTEVFRDLSGNNSGGLMQTSPTDEGAGTWNPSPSAVIRIERLTHA